jgi:hypothetical protein
MAALLLAPQVGTSLGALAITALFAAGNAWRAGMPQVVALCAGFASLMAMVAAALLLSRGWWAVSLFGGLGGVVGAVFATEGRFGRAIGRHTELELLAIGGSLLVGGALALAGGAEPRRVVLMASALWTWELIGLWWVRGQLSRILKGRAPWGAGPWVWGPSWLVLGLLGAAWSTPWVAAIPVGYGLRTWSTRRVTSGSEIRRIGLSEAAWTTVAAFAGFVASGG